MARPIDGDALGIYKYETFDAFRGFVEVIPFGLIETAPTMTLEPEPMEWISMVKPDAEAWRECSACGAEVKGIAFTFCPYCGRKARNGVNAHE